MTTEELKNDISWPEFGRIPREVEQYTEKNAGSLANYVGFLQVLPGEDIGLRTFAYKRPKDKAVLITEVERATVNTNGTVRKNIYFTPIGGYHPVFKPQTHSTGNWYGYTSYYFSADDFGKWYQEPKRMGLHTAIINLDLIFTTEKYKYCGYSGGDVLDYLRKYSKDSRVEYFGKIGIQPADSLLKLASKDKQFMRYLIQHKEELQGYGPQIITHAFKNKITPVQASRELQQRREYNNMTWFCRGEDINRQKLGAWMQENDIHPQLYKDYFEAIKGLNLDLHDTKNTQPREFMRMHDLRIDEWESAKAKQEKKEKRQMYADFKKKAESLKDLEIENGKYCLIIPGSIQDLKKEGNALHHCVGKMGYDKKMIEGRCIIGFIRIKGSEDKPFVTCEYSPERKKVVQCYGHHDSKPEAEALEFADKWALYINRKAKKHELAKST